MGLLPSNLKSKRKVALLKIEPLNFRIKPQDEKEAIVKSFQGFLNSLDFPIQICITTDQINLDYYLKNVEKSVENLKEDVYGEIFSGYRKHLGNIIKSVNVVNRTFYICVPETSNLDIQVEVIRDKLSRVGLRNRKLKQEEVVAVLSRFFNDLGLEDDDKNNYALEKITPTNLTKFSISPKYVKNSPEHLRINHDLNTILYATGYPRTVTPGFLDPIITSNGDFDIAIHIEPFRVEDLMLNLNRDLNKQRADLWAAEKKGSLNQTLQIKYADTKSVLEMIQKGNQKLFNVSLYINCKARDEKKLELLTSKVKSELNSSLIQSKPALYRMMQGIQSIMPTCRNVLGIKRNVTTTALSAFFPFTSQFLESDVSGIWYGVNKTGIPIIKDIFKLTNPNGMILASSGGGKSYTAKLVISRNLLNGTKVMVIDPQNEYAELSKTFKGQLVTISKDSDVIINPLDLMGHDYTEKRLTLLDVFKIMLGDVSEIQRAVLDKALTRTYERKGIKDNNPATWKRQPPILGDLLKELEMMAKKASRIEEKTYSSLINRLGVYVHGVFKFFNRHTKIDFTNRFVTFNIGNMPKQCKPLVMFLILDYVYMKMKNDRERKLLVVDEAWSLLSRAEEAGYIFEIVKTCRKYNLGMLLITQDVADLVASQAGNALLANSSYTILLRQKPAVINNVSKTFHLSLLEKDRLLTAGPGEGIFICENEHNELKVIASPEEHKVVTTNADELLKMKEEKKEEQPEENKEKILEEIEKKVDNIDEKRKKENITDKKFIKRVNTVRETIKAKHGLDITKLYFRCDGLQAHETKELLDNDYKQSRHVPLGGGGPKQFFLKPVHHSESAEHFFLVKAIEEYLRDFTSEIELKASVGADVIFNANGEIWAIEVETGTVYDTNPKKFMEKVITMNTTYGDCWMFVVTKSKYKYKYEEHAPTYTRGDIQKKIRLIFKLQQSCKQAAKKTDNKKKASLPSRKNKTKKASSQLKEAQNKSRSAKKAYCSKKLSD